MKKLFGVFLSVMMILTIFPLSVFAENVASGTCGENLTWILDSDGTLTISGSGDMYDFNEDSEPLPWSDVKDLIVSVVIDDEVTSVGVLSFTECKNLKNVQIGAGVTKIGDLAFSSTGIENLVIPENVSKIGASAFNHNDSLKTVDIYSKEVYLDWYAFYSDSNLESVVFHNSAAMIGPEVFRFCTNLKNLDFGDSLISIDEAAFIYCTGLKSVTIPDSVTKMDGCCLGWDFDFGNEMYDGFVIYGYEGSVAQQYANEYSIKFVTLESESTTAETTTNAPETTTVEHTTAEVTTNTPETTMVEHTTAEPTTNAPETTTVEPATTDSTTNVPETTAFEKVSELESDVSTVTLGDLNSDGEITAADARTALRISAKLETATDKQLLAADVNNDGEITAADARKILRFSARLEEF